MQHKWMLQHLHSQVLAVAHLFCNSPPGDPADVLTRSTACLPPQATCSSCSGSPSNTDARIHVLHSRSPRTALLLRCQLTSLWQASQQRCLAALRCRPMQARQLVAAQRPGNADVAAFCAPAGVPNFSQQQAERRQAAVKLVCLGTKLPMSMCWALLLVACLHSGAV